MLPCLYDDTTRLIICRNAETMQGSISNATCEMLECGCERVDVLDTALGCFCDEMVDQGRELTYDLTELVSAFMDFCLAEASILRRPDTGTGQCELLPGYFSPEHHAIMSERIGEYIRIFYEFYQLYRQDEADGIHVIELTTENFCDVLDDFGHEVSPELRNAVTEHAKLGLFTITAVQEALSSSSQPRWQPALPSPGTCGLAGAETPVSGLSAAVPGELFCPDFPHHFNVYPVAWNTPPEYGIRTAIFRNGYNPERRECLKKSYFPHRCKGYPFMGNTPPE